MFLCFYEAFSSKKTKFLQPLKFIQTKTSSAARQAGLFFNRPDFWHRYFRLNHAFLGFNRQIVSKKWKFLLFFLASGGKRPDSRLDFIFYSFPDQLSQVGKIFRLVFRRLA